MSSKKKVVNQSDEEQPVIVKNTAPRKNNKKCELVFTSLSYKDIVSEHFGAATTTISGSQLNKHVQKENSGLEIVDKKKQNFETRAEYFFDSKKNKIKFWPIMIDHSKDNILSLFTNKPCRNCHHPYETHPIGCPIAYFPHDPAPNNPKRIIMESFLKENNFPTDRTDFFETEHMFCSFPCVKSYILSFLSKSPQSYKYTNALSYTYLLYKKIFGIKGNENLIPCAHPIEVLLSYGGHLKIEEYRECMGILSFDHTITTKRPFMFTNTSYLEERNIQNEIAKKVV